MCARLCARACVRSRVRDVFAIYDKQYLTQADNDNTPVIKIIILALKVILLDRLQEINCSVIQEP